MASAMASWLLQKMTVAVGSLRRCALTCAWKLVVSKVVLSELFNYQIKDVRDRVHHNSSL